MFDADDFKLSLEAQLRLRVINDDIDNCEDTKALKTQLKECVRLTMTYQQMLQKVMEKTIMRDLDDWFEKLEQEAS